MWAILPGVLCLGCHHRTRVQEDWTLDRLVNEIQACGDEWISHPAHLGIVCKRVSDPLPWETLVEESLEHHERWASKSGRLYITYNQGYPERQGVYQERGVLYLGPLTVRGHPTELERIRELLRR